MDILMVVLPAVVLLLGAGTFFKIINLGKPLWAYLFLVCLPLWLCYFPFGFVNGIFGKEAPEASMAETVLYRVAGIIYILDAIVIVYLLVKLMAPPAGAPLAESPFGIARRQLHYGLFTTVIYGVVCVIPAFVYYISLARGVIDTASVIAGVPPENMSGFSALIIGTIVMCWNPFGWLFGSLIAVMGIWVTTVAVAAAATALALSVSGTIRFLRAEKPFPKKHLLYVLAMLVPIVNIFAMLRLCGKIKKKEITA